MKKRNVGSERHIENFSPGANEVFRYAQSIHCTEHVNRNFIDYPKDDIDGMFMFRVSALSRVNVKEILA